MSCRCWRSSACCPRDEAGFGFEIKWDGIRAISYYEPGRFRIESRNLNDITAQYPELRRLGRQLGSRDAILDGEIVALRRRRAGPASSGFSTACT